MMRSGLLAVLAFLLGGCALPRAIFLYGRVQRESPHGSWVSHQKTDVQAAVIPELTRAGGTVTFDSKVDADETFARIKQELLARGWRPAEPDTEWDPPTEFKDGTRSGIYSAERKPVWKIGGAAIPYADEHLELFIDSGGGATCRVQMDFEGDYAWDWPTRIGNGMVFLPLLELEGEGAVMVVPVLMWF